MTVEEKTVLQKSQRYSKWLSQKMYYSVVKDNQRTWTLKRGEIYFADLGQNVGSEENIISSSQITIPDLQIQIENNYQYEDNDKNVKMLKGTIDLGQIKTIAKERIVSRKVCRLVSEISNSQKSME